MNTVTIEKGTTALYVVCLPSGRLAEAQSISVLPFLKNMLVEYEWDQKRRVNVHRYSYYLYNKETGVLHLPVNLLFYFQRFLDNHLVSYEIKELPPNQAEPIIVNNLGTFTDRDYQIESINFLADPSQHMKALELQTGCITGDMEIGFNYNNLGFSLTIAEAYEHFHSVGFFKYTSWQQHYPLSTLSYKGDGISFNPVLDIVYSGLREVYKLTLDDGHFLKCTADHEVLSSIGMIRADLALGNRIMVSSGKYSKAISFEYLGVEPTYDIQCQAPYHNFVANGIVIHNSGKTYVATRTIMELQQRSLIIVPAFLLDQWSNVLSTLVDTPVATLQGNRSIAKLIENNYQTDVGIFIASITTLQEYALRRDVYDVMPPIREFFKGLRIGVKIIDEAHLNFYAVAMIDVQSDIYHNIYLSATYMRSSRTSDLIFKKIYPQSIRYVGKEYEKYVDIYEAQYSLGGLPERAYKSQRGYDQYRYEKYIMRKSSVFFDFFNRILHPLIVEYYITKKRPGQKLLLIVGLKDFASDIAHWFKETYPDLRTVAFLQGTNEDVLDDAEVIVSTTGSAGTGRDIKNLRTMILFKSFNSDALTLQTIGRLRKMEDTPIFVYMVNTGIPSHKHHADARRATYRHIGKSFSIIDL